MPPDGTQARATSVDGRNFAYQLTPDRLDVATGGYARLEHSSGHRLGQVTRVALTGEGLAAVEGRVLDGSSGPFHDAHVRPARSGEVAASLERVRPERAGLSGG